MARGAPPPIWDVVEEHLDEAAFLWTQWEAALASPRYAIAEVAAGPEERLVAHLDGVAVAGEAADERLLVPALTGRDPGRVAAAAAVLAAAGRLAPVRAAVRADAPGAAGAIARALGLALSAGAEPALVRWLDDADPAAQAVALDALAFRGAAPAPDVRALLAAADPKLRAAVLRASPILGDGARQAVEASLDDADPSIRDAAVEAGLRLGLRSAWAACQRAADAGRPTALALEVLAASGEPADVERIAAAARVPVLRRAALFAAGLSGTVRGADLCAAHLEDEQVARTAAEGIWAVTGLAVEGVYAAREPEGAEEPVPLAAEKLDSPALPPEDAALPFPDAEMISLHWRDARGRLAPGPRLLFGAPWAAEGALRAFAQGPTRRRHALARELSVRSRGEWRADTRAWARDQLRAQGERRLTVRADLGLPFSRLLRP